MGRLIDAMLNKVPQKTPQITPSIKPQPKCENYTHTWLADTANVYGFTMSQNLQKVNGILGALNRREGQCPCGGSGEQFKCPCAIMREHQICKCGLFETLTNRNIKSTSTTAHIDANE